jgi:hypothetical protein
MPYGTWRHLLQRTKTVVCNLMAMQRAGFQKGSYDSGFYAVYGRLKDSRRCPPDRYNGAKEVLSTGSYVPFSNYLLKNLLTK